MIGANFQTVESVSARSYCLFIVMGLGQGLSSNGGRKAVPSRPIFAWNNKDAPWTDARQDQSGYARATKSWKWYHESLPAENSLFKRRVPSLTLTSLILVLTKRLPPFLLLRNSNANNAQRISILAAESPSGIMVKAEDHYEEALKLVSYESMASTICQCEKMKPYSVTNPSQVNAAYQRYGRLSPAELQGKKRNSQCRRCHQFGHQMAH